MTEQAFRADLEGHWYGPLGYEFDVAVVDGRIVVTSPTDGAQRLYDLDEVVTFVNKRIWRRAAHPNLLGGP